MINQYLLHTYYSAWLEYIHEKDGKVFTSFGNSNYLIREEGYKKEIYELGRKQLAFEDWKVDDIGTGNILRKVFEAIEFQTYPDYKKFSKLNNNLVFTSSHSYTKVSTPTKEFQRMLAENDTDQAELILYSLYKDGSTDQESFEKLIGLVGKRYSLIAYLMFLKNDRRYLPLAPERFEEHLGFLGSAIELSGKCSWQNYMDFMGELIEVKNFLSEQIGEDVHLLDAHSFVWQLNLFTVQKEELKPVVMNIIVDSEYAQSDFSHGSVISSITPEEIEESNIKKKEKGVKAESTVLNYEKNLLTEQGREDLANRVEQVSVKNSNLGYDIVSFTESGEPKYIEVKTAHKSGGTLRFFLSLNEIRKSSALSNYCFYLVVFTAHSPEIYILKSPFNLADVSHLGQIELPSNIFIQPKNMYVSVPIKVVKKG